MMQKTKRITPGSILVRMYLKERLKRQRFLHGRFLEVGAGKGNISQVLLKHGLSGIGLDLNEVACDWNERLNNEFVSRQNYQVICHEFLTHQFEQSFDIIISSMLIEHMDEVQVGQYFKKAKSLLTEKGKIITLVSAQMKVWSKDDALGGHFKRYSFDCFHTIAQEHKLKIVKLVGLTFPVSNVLRSIGQYLFRKKKERQLEALSATERTKRSGNHHILFKTEFPAFLNCFLMRSPCIPSICYKKQLGIITIQW